MEELITVSFVFWVFSVFYSSIGYAIMIPVIKLNSSV
jgi:hypothetical protein